MKFKLELEIDINEDDLLYNLNMMSFGEEDKPNLECFSQSEILECMDNYNMIEKEIVKNVCFSDYHITITE